MYPKEYHNSHAFLLLRFGEYLAPAAVCIRQRMEAGSGVMTNLMRKVRKGEQRFPNSG